MGTYKVTVTLQGNYTGSASEQFIIKPKEVTPKVTLSKTSYTYNGKAQKPDVTVKYDDKELKEEEDYTVKYASGCKNAGTYKVTVTLQGNYTGSATAQFTIKPKEVTPQVTLSKTSYTYNGKAQKPDVAVRADNAVLTENTDYTVMYDSGCKDVGTYKATVTLRGNYTGKSSKTFTIGKSENTLKVKEKDVTISYTTIKKKNATITRDSVIEVSKAQGTVQYAKTSGHKKILVDIWDGTITVKKGLKKGTYYVKVNVTALGNKNYKKMKQEAKFIIKVV